MQRIDKQPFVFGACAVVLVAAAASTASAGRPPKNPDPPGYEILHLMFNKMMLVNYGATHPYDSLENRWHELSGITSPPQVYYANGPNGKAVPDDPTLSDQWVAFGRPNPNPSDPRELVDVALAKYKYEKARVYYLPASRNGLPSKVDFEIRDRFSNDPRREFDDVPIYNNPGDRGEEDVLDIKATDKFVLTPEGSWSRTYLLPAGAVPDDINSRHRVNFIVFPTTNSGGYKVFLSYYRDGDSRSSLLTLDGS